MWYERGSSDYAILLHSLKVVKPPLTVSSTAPTWWHTVVARYLTGNQCVDRLLTRRSCLTPIKTGVPAYVAFAFDEYLG
jgi:hypothetical protein